MDVGKVFPVADIGSPLQSKKLLLVSLLLEAGYSLGKTGTNYEDSVDLANGKRTWVFLFDGSHRVDWQGTVLLPKQCADYLVGKLTDPPGPMLRCRRALYAAYDPAKPLPVAPSDSELGNVLIQHDLTINAIRKSPKHVISHRGRARYWLPAELTADQREIEMDKIDNRYKKSRV